MDESLEKLLADLVATSNDTSTFDEALSYFPEFKNVDSKLLADFVATAQDVGSVREAISYFPEFTGDQTTSAITSSITKSLAGAEPEKELVDMQDVDRVFELVNNRELYSTRDLAMERAREAREKASKYDLDTPPGKYYSPPPKKKKLPRSL